MDQIQVEFDLHLQQTPHFLSIFLGTLHKSSKYFSISITNLIDSDRIVTLLFMVFPSSNSISCALYLLLPRQQVDLLTISAFNDLTSFFFRKNMNLSSRICIGNMYPTRHRKVLPHFGTPQSTHPHTSLFSPLTWPMVDISYCSISSIFPLLRKNVNKYGFRGVFGNWS